jgi:hypothetical protein
LREALERIAKRPKDPYRSASTHDRQAGLGSNAPEPSSAVTLILMITALDDTVSVHYRQIYLASEPDDLTRWSTDHWVGQTNGLCGAAVPGLLYLKTGLHTGQVRFTVHVYDTEPSQLFSEWEDVVEVSFRPATDDVALVEWGNENWYPLPLTTIDYRVRYCATGMDEGCEKQNAFEDDVAPDRYVLQFWPAPAASDSILRQTSRFAAHSHEVVRRETIG